MLFPVRCFTCGKVVANKYETYKRMCLEGLHPGDVLDFLKIKRYCCRSVFLCYIDIIDEILEYR